MDPATDHRLYEERSDGLTKNSPYAAFWDGLDGYNSGSVEQTGTIGYCSGATAKYYAWYEMYPAGSVVYSQPVAPGDEISASVVYSTTTTITGGAASNSRVSKAA